MTTIEESGVHVDTGLIGLEDVRGVRTMTMPTGGSSPTPIHRALDRLTASKLELQVLRRQLQLGEALDPETLAVQLVQIDGWLDEIAVVLNEERENKTRNATR
jgi:hypothetical protein